MGCAASTTASAPAAQAQGGQQTNVQIVSATQQQLPSRPVPASQLQRPPAQNQTQRLPNLTNAGIVRSLVSLKREDCPIERAPEGHFLKLKISASSNFEAVVFFIARVVGEDGEKELRNIEAKEVNRASFSRGSCQPCRIFLCKELQPSLESFTEEKDKHHLVVELRADSSDAKAITVERSFLKINSEGTIAQIVAQMVKCGTAVRQLQALYGTLPNLRMTGTSSQGTSGEEGGDCVICLSKPREVAILHCRHVCLCRSCATITSSTWSFQCPVCRGRVAAMVGTSQGSE